MFPLSDVIPSRTTPFVTIAFILLTALAFAIELALDDAMLWRVVRTYGVVPGDLSWWAPVTAPFLHTGWLHVLVNMVYLWIFGASLEDRLGHVRFLIFFLACGPIAALGHAAMSPHTHAPLIGASGAVAGVMGAYFVFYPRSRVLTGVFLVVIVDVVEVPAAFFLGIWCVLQLLGDAGAVVTGAAVGGAALWAYLSGFGVGVLYGAVQRAMGRDRRWD
jgi:membrane associated rhomboid family serine protease